MELDLNLEQIVEQLVELGLDFLELKGTLKMNLKELDALANSDLAIEKTMSLLDYGYCMKMRELYNDYKAGTIALESCKQRKREIVKEYEKYSSELVKSKDTYKEYQDGLKLSEMLRADVNKSKDVERMLIDCLRIISVLTGDKVFYDLNAKKLDGTEKNT